MLILVLSLAMGALSGKASAEGHPSRPISVIVPFPPGGVAELTARPLLAVASEKRHPAFPNIPTLRELGYDVEYYMWCGFFAPKGTPPDILKTLREATRKAAASPEFKAAMEKMNTPIDYRDSEEFQKFWDQDAQRSIEAVRRIGKVQ